MKMKNAVIALAVIVVVVLLLRSRMEGFDEPSVAVPKMDVSTNVVPNQNMGDLSTNVVPKPKMDIMKMHRQMNKECNNRCMIISK
jgi:hypothetical protein